MQPEVLAPIVMGVFLAFFWLVLATRAHGRFDDLDRELASLRRETVAALRQRRPEVG